MSTRQVTVYLPEDLHEILKEIANQRCYSLNKLIIYLLRNQKEFTRQDPETQEEIDDEATRLFG